MGFGGGVLSLGASPMVFGDGDLATMVFGDGDLAAAVFDGDLDACRFFPLSCRTEPALGWVWDLLALATAALILFTLGRLSNFSRYPGVLGSSRRSCGLFLFIPHGKAGVVQPPALGRCPSSGTAASGEMRCSWAPRGVPL